VPTTTPRASVWTNGRVAWGLGAVATLAVLLTIGGPGITVDEPLDVRPGRVYVQTLLARGWRFFEPATVRRVFEDNKEHPPLGRWLLGIASTLGETFELAILGRDPVGIYVRSGRIAPAICFGILVGIVALEAGRRGGRGAGLVAGLALLSMPRAFAHAQFGALDTFVALFWTWSLLRAERALGSSRPVAAMAGAGFVWALILLTKIHAWLLPPIVLARALTKLAPRRALVAVAAWAMVGLVVFVAGWPWLWYDSADRLWGYLRTGVERSPIFVQYFGRVYRDRDVPWHYPWLYFAATVPIGLQLLGICGLIRAWLTRRGDGSSIVLAGAIFFLLVIFSTNVPVYDGERLFLPVFPLWAILVGQGFAAVWEAIGGRVLRIGLLALVLAQSYGVLMTHPFGLSYYNVLVGGLPGAERLGLELTYWGDAVDGILLDRLAHEAGPGQSAALAPTLAPDQGTIATTRALVQVPLILRDESAVTDSDWVVVYRRSAYWKPAVRDLVRRPPLFVRTRQGVWLSGIWTNPQPKMRRDELKARP
jgi:hypothetical protein